MLESPLLTKLDMIEDILESSINGYNLNSCIQVSRGKDLIAVRSNISDEVSMFKFDSQSLKTYYFRGSFSIELTTKSKIEKLILSEIIYQKSDKCSHCKVGCRF